MHLNSLYCPRMFLTAFLAGAPPEETTHGILIAAVIAFVAAVFFPARTQSSVWIKVFGTQWGAVAGGRAWTFISVFVIGSLLWGFLLWLPTHQ
jgi:hypothetical protein